MPRHLLILLFLLIISPLRESYAQSFKVPAKPPKYRAVNDYTKVIKSNYADSLTQLLHGFEKANGAQIAIVSIQKLPKNVSIEEYSIKLARTWRIGQKEKDNGVLVIFVLENRKMRIEVGYGLEDLIPDLAAQKIIDKTLKIAFREQKYGKGLYEACQILCDLIDEDLKAQEFIHQKPSGWWITILIFSIIGFFTGAFIGLSLKRYAVIFIFIWLLCILGIAQLFSYYYNDLGLDGVIWFYLLSLPLSFYFLMQFFGGLASRFTFIDSIKSGLGLDGSQAKLWQAMKEHFGGKAVEAKREEFMNEARKLHKELMNGKKNRSAQYKLSGKVREFRQKPEEHLTLLAEIKKRLVAEIEEKAFNTIYWEAIGLRHGQNKVKSGIEKLRGFYELALENEEKRKSYDLVKEGGFIYRFYYKYFRLLMENPISFYNKFIVVPKKQTYSYSSGSSVGGFGYGRSSSGYSSSSSSSSSSSYYSSDSSSDWGGGDFGGGGASGDW